MEGRTEDSHNGGLRPGHASLKGFYLVGVMATVLGIMVIFLNDEIGVPGDAGNAMIKGFAEREMIRDTFGRYVITETRPSTN
jgi:hypothetical protein